jgi:hypothetical protein
LKVAVVSENHFGDFDTFSRDLAISGEVNDSPTIGTADEGARFLQLGKQRGIVFDAWYGFGHGLAPDGSWPR